MLLQEPEEELAFAGGPAVPVDELVPFVDESVDVLVLVLVGVADPQGILFAGIDVIGLAFPDWDPVGEILQVSDVPYLVIGVLNPRLQMGTYKGPDAMGAVIPITTFAAQSEGVDARQIVRRLVEETTGEGITSSAGRSAASRS